MKFAAAVTSLLLVLAAGTAAADEPPAALVMAVAGVTAPKVEAMSEIPSGTPVKLEPGAELTLLDYARCKMVTVSGGTVTVTRFDFVADGKIVAQADAPCPRIHRLSAAAGGAVAGGLVMRGIAGAPRWPLNRELVFAGDGSDKLKSAAIYAEGKLDSPVSRLDVSGHKARFAADAAPLSVNDHYVLRLTIGDRPQPVDIPFIGGAPSGPSLLVVLRGQ